MPNDFLTAEEIAQKYHMSVNTLKNQFTRIQEKIKKQYGVQLQKTGRGNDTKYYIQRFDNADPNRALSLYQSMEKNLIPAELAAGLLDLHFLIFIAIVSSPQRAFRGSYYDLLDYIEMQTTEQNIIQARNILKNLSDNNYIMYMEDKTDNLYFMATILRKTETDMELEIQAINKFKTLLTSSRKSWIPVMKTYLALCFIEQPCTIAEIAEATNLSGYKVKDCLRLLKENNIIHKEILNRTDNNKHFYCLGSQIDINVFGINDQT